MSDTKEKILIGTQQVLVGNGFVNRDIETVLREARISKGRFYSFFKTKEELLSAILDFESNKLFDKLEELFDNSANPLTILNSFLDWKLVYFSSNGSVLARFGSEFVDKEIHLKKKVKKIYGDYTSYIVRLLEDSVQSGQLIRSTPVRELANFIVFSLEGGSISVNLTNSKEQFGDVINMIKRVVRTYRDLEIVSNV
ncbi:TetR/AcrR family transcriptional regulator [Candidatus Dojkabacteria bacterium]|nr:TetR/AcrR family transcriptional regulator [Candidatus Dojkabacteria bacterium]